LRLWKAPVNGDGFGGCVAGEDWEKIERHGGVLHDGMGLGAYRTGAWLLVVDFFWWARFSLGSVRLGSGLHTSVWFCI
jgi:hypothetical protein